LSSRIFIFLLVSFSFFCCSEPIEKPGKKELVKKNYFELCPEIKSLLNGSSYNTDGNFWALTQSTDSTCRIDWGNSSIDRKGKNNFSFCVARHFSSVLFNEKYIVLRSHWGSDAWFEVYLPLDSTKEEILIDNPLARDWENNLVAYEGFGDTILVVKNLNNGINIPILEREFKCDSPIWHYCLDSVLINNRTLFYQISTTDKKGEKVKRKIRLN
jgi:hypothetical protein